MRKILVLGAGAQGNVICSVLSRADDVGSIVLADIDVERARGTQANLGSSKIDIQRADATKLDELTALMRGGAFDLVVNVALPEFIPTVLKAALQARIHYVDLSSVRLLENAGNPIEQLEDAGEWKSSGKTALVNGGSAPGLTNIMAREGTDELDTVDSIRIRDYSETESDEFVAFWALPVYAIDCATEPFVWENGGHKKVPIFSGAEEYEFPPPIGRRAKVYQHAHEEPLTIPLFVGKPVAYCDYKLGEPEIDTWRFMVEKLGLMDERPVDIGGARVSPRQVLLKKLPKTIEPQKLSALVEAGRLEARTMVVSDVRGKKDGRDVRIQLWAEPPSLSEASRIVPGTSDVSLMTSVPAAIFSLMLLRGQIRRTGIVLPEMLGQEERGIFYRGIAAYGIRIHRRTESTLPGTGASA